MDAEVVIETNEEPNENEDANNNGTQQGDALPPTFLFNPVTQFKTRDETVWEKEPFAETQPVARNIVRGRDYLIKLNN